MAELTPTDYAFLFLLKIENREISNTELDKAYGVRIVGDNYARLNGSGYVETKKIGSVYFHTLLPSGKKLLSGPVEVTRDAAGTKKSTGREQQLWAALSALHNSQHGRPRVTPPNGHRGLEERIRAVYAELATEPGAFVSLSRLRPKLADVTKPELDRALEALLDASDVELEPEDNQKTLKDAEKRAAVRIGGEDRHLLAIGMR
ncbi:hypothetical protein ACQP00_37910 [Dactylosporangium sp. CS-047395]|uniref:hypothetical protein n=1 Tax=Dactylosporangium sp. CS-047395 TaxID=3239936 RepID=UPI003D90040C